MHYCNLMLLSKPVSCASQLLKWNMRGLLAATFLMITFLSKEGLSQGRRRNDQFGDPPGCLLNRIDVVPCEFRNPDSTAVPGENEYGVYTTRIRPDRQSGELGCSIRRNNHAVIPIDTVGNDPRIKYIFSPGQGLSNRRSYGNQLYVKYRIVCPSNHVAFFNLTFIDMEEASCMDPNFDEPRCKDYIQVSRRGGQFGSIEICGNTIPTSLREQLDSGSIEITLRTSDTRRFPGFRACVICFRPQSVDDDDNGDRRKRSIDSFNAKVERHVSHVKRMRRSTGEVCTVLCRFEEINVSFGAGIIYEDQKISIVDTTTMAVLRRLRSPINRLTTLDFNGTQNVFIRGAPSTNGSATILSGPGPLTVTGVFVFFTTFAVIPELGNIPPELVIPVGREADVTFELVNAHFQQVLETDDEILPDEVLEPPPFDLEELGFETEMTVAPGNTLGLTGLLHGRRRKRVADPFEPRQCNYTDQILTTAILNQAATNPVLATVVDVIMNCTESEQPGRIVELIETIAIEFQFTQEMYLVREDADSITVCLEIVTDGFLPRDVEMNIMTQDGNATEPDDYTSVNASFIFVNGTSQGGPGSQMCVEIAIRNDSLVEFDEFFQVTADSPDPNINTSLVSADVFILDDDVKFLITTIPGNTFSLSEMSGGVTILVDLVLGELPFQVFVTLINQEGGTAIEGEDYLFQTGVFGAGNRPIPGFNIRILNSILFFNDQVVENPRIETLSVRVSTVPIGRLVFSGSPGLDVIEGTITDDDVAVFQFTQTEYTVEESVGDFLVTIELIEGTLGIPITVTVQDVPMSGSGSVPPGASEAAEGQDYIGFLVNLTFPAESAPGTKVSANVSINDDGENENNEIIVIMATVLSPGLFFETSGNTTFATVLLMDNDYFRFTQETYFVAEDAGTITVCIEIVADGFLPRDIEMNIFTLDGNATEPSDYASVNTSFIFVIGTSRGGVGSQMCVEVVIGDDPLVEFDEFFQVRVESPDPTVNTSLLKTAVVIVDNDVLDFRFSQEFYFVQEDAGSATVCIEIVTQGFLPRDIEMSIITQNGNATAPNDYTSVNASFIFVTGTSQGGPGSQVCAVVPIANDALVEFDEFFQVTADSPDPNINTSLILAAVFVLDDDSFQFTQEMYSVQEDAGSVSVCIEFVTDGPLPRDTEMNVVTQDGDATAPDDYTSVNTSFIFVTGTLQGGPGSQMCVSIAVRNDTLVEFDESFQVIAGLITATVFIRDDETVGFEFLDMSYTIMEDAGDNIIEVCIVIITNGILARNIQYDITTADGTATAPADYTSLSASIIFVNGTSQGGPGSLLCVEIAITSDSLFERDEIFEVRAVSQDPIIDTIILATVTILDDDPIECPELTLEIGAVTYTTDTMANFIQGTIATHSCDNGFVLNGSVTRTCMDNGMDFVGVWSGSAPTCALIECPELTLDNGAVTYATDTMANFEVGTTARHSCHFGFSLQGSVVRTCEDDDGMDTVGVWSDSASTCAPIECPGLTLDNGAVTYATDTSPNFELGTVATHSCNNGFILQGSVTRSCVNDDGVDIVGVWSGTAPTCSPIECPGLSLENGVVTYSTDTSPNFELGTIATHFCNTGLSLQGPVTRTCVNDDGIDIVGVWSGSPPTCSHLPPDGDLIIEFEQLQYAVNEDGISIDVCVTISSSLVLGQTVSASYETVDLTATAGADYVDNTGTFVFDSTSGLRQCVSIGIVDDATSELDESFLVQSTSVEVLAQVATVTIVDNDPPPDILINPEQISYFVQETAGGVTVCVVAADTPSSSQSISIGYQTSAVTAQPGQDYTEQGGTLVFTSSSIQRMCVTIPILDDGPNENTESFSITFTQQTSSGPRVTVVSVFIIDNDPRVILQSTQFDVNEEDLQLEICAVLENVMGNTFFPIEVTFSLTEDSASASDFWIPPGGLTSTFVAGSINGDTACITVSITDDDSLEGNEEFNVAIDSVADSSGGGNIVLTGVPSMGSVVIMDDEEVTVVLEDPASPLTLLEDGSSGSPSINVMLMNIPAEGLQRELVVTLTTIDINSVAVEGTDYTVAVPFEVTFPAGFGNSASVSGCMALQDNSIEGDHSFAVSLDSVSVQFMNNVMLDPSTVEVTIVDDDVDDVQVTLVRATAGVAEDGGVDAFCASISLLGNTLDTDIEFTLDDMGDGIAVEGEDFTLGATELVFPNGTMEGGMACVDVTIINDNVLEFDHSFEVSILLPSSPPGASLAAASPDNTEYTIMDDEAIECPGLTLENGAVTYATDTMANFELGTIATHSCNFGYVLQAEAALITRTCMDDDGTDNVGVWSGPAPTCAPIELQFTQEIYPVNEDEGSVEVCIEIVTDGFLTEDFEINIMTQDGNATEPDDYTSVNTAIIFVSGTSRGDPESQMCVDISITNDVLVEFDELFQVTADSSIDTVTIVDVFILDDDVKFLIAIVPGNSFSLNENSFGVTIFIDLALGVLPFEVDVTLITQEGGTAIEGEDYMFQNGAFGAGSTPGQSVTLLIQFLNDDIVEPLENLTVGVSTQPTARLIFSDSPGLDVIEGTITDDD